MRTVSKDKFAYKMTMLTVLASGMAVVTLMAAFLGFDYVSSRAELQGRLATLADILAKIPPLRWISKTARRLWKFCKRCAPKVRSFLRAFTIGEDIYSPTISASSDARVARPPPDISWIWAGTIQQ